MGQVMQIYGQEPAAGTVVAAGSGVRVLVYALPGAAPVSTIPSTPLQTASPPPPRAAMPNLTGTWKHPEDANYLTAFVQNGTHVTGRGMGRDPGRTYEGDLRQLNADTWEFKYVGHGANGYSWLSINTWSRTNPNVLIETEGRDLTGKSNPQTWGSRGVHFARVTQR
jgi:hypothetical protein